MPRVNKPGQSHMNALAVTEATPAESASTESVIEGALSAAEDRGDFGDMSADNDTSSDADGSDEDNGTVGHAATVEQAATPQKGLTPEQAAAIDAELGFTPGKKNNNRIPHERVREMFAKAKAKIVEETQQKYSRFESPEFATDLQAIELARSNPKGFVQAIMATPAFAQYMRQPDAESAERRQPAQAQAPAEEPGPDRMDHDGTLTYSAQRLAEVMQFREAKLERMIDERLKPVAEIQKERQLTQQWDSALGRQRTVIEEARSTWPGFRESEAQIRELLYVNENLSLDAAYRQAVMPKFQSDRDRMRAEILVELNRRPAAATGVIPSAAPATNTGLVDTEDIIRQAIAGM